VDKQKPFVEDVHNLEAGINEPTDQNPDAISALTLLNVRLKTDSIRHVKHQAMSCCCWRR